MPYTYACPYCTHAVQPNRPEEFSIFEPRDLSVGVMWETPPISLVQPIDEYVLQLSYEERGTITSSVVGCPTGLAPCTHSVCPLLPSQTIPSGHTSYVVRDMVPGVSYSLVLRSSNLAGLSSPTSSLTHDTIIARELTCTLPPSLYLLTYPLFPSRCLLWMGCTPLSLHCRSSSRVLHSRVTGRWSLCFTPVETGVLRRTGDRHLPNRGMYSSIMMYMCP